MTVALVTFSDESMIRSACLCVESARQHGADEARLVTQLQLQQTEFYRDNRQLLDAPRGCGYFAWKPWLIAEAMGELRNNDILTYSDAGVEIIDNLNYIIDRMDQDIWLFGNMHEHAHWCKRDIVEAIYPQKPSDEAFYYPAPWEFFGKQVQASVIFFRVNDHTRAFVKEWLDWCLTKTVPDDMRIGLSCGHQWRGTLWSRCPACGDVAAEMSDRYLIDDSPSIMPNHPEFRENRHDQAILTTMAYRDGIKLHWWPAQYNDGAFVYERGDYPDEGYPVMFHHHRKRNHEWAT